MNTLAWYSNLCLFCSGALQFPVIMVKSIIKKPSSKCWPLPVNSYLQVTCWDLFILSAKHSKNEAQGKERLSSIALSLQLLSSWVASFPRAISTIGSGRQEPTRKALLHRESHTEPSLSQHPSTLARHNPHSHSRVARHPSSFPSGKWFYSVALTAGVRHHPCGSFSTPDIDPLNTFLPRPSYALSIWRPLILRSALLL
jgi:hypothetical protein